MSLDNLSSSIGQCCLKRKMNDNNLKKPFQRSNFIKILQKCANAHENTRASSKMTDDDLLKIVPESIRNFFVLYIKQTNAINDLYECLERTVENGKSLFGSNEILSQVRYLSRKHGNGLKHLTSTVVEELCNASKILSSVSPSYLEPEFKMRKVESSSSLEGETKFISGACDDDIDFAGSDIDLQLDEIVEKCESSAVNSPARKHKSVIFGNEGGTLDNDNESRKLNYDSDGYVKVFVDGSCLSNGKSNAQAGIGVWFGENHPLNVSERAKGLPTNNNAEIQAATQAIVKAHSVGVKKLRLYTDSQFVINCMTKWIWSWKKNNWINSSNKPVINKISLMELDKVIPMLDAVDWKYVEGHKGNIGNERADLLAREGAKKCDNHLL